MTDSEQVVGRAAPASGGGVDPAPLPTRRRFTADYRARFVAEYEAAPHGQKALVLRREGLHQSQVAEWTAVRDAAAAGDKYARRSHQPATARKPGSGGGKELERLRRENERLARDLAASRQVVDIMGKLQGLLEQISESTDAASGSTPR